MSMSITVECRPNTLAEAEIANEIAKAVAEIVVKHGGSPNSLEHIHEIRRYPESKGNDKWYDAGLVVKRTDYLHADGASIPLLKQVEE